MIYERLVKYFHRKLIQKVLQGRNILTMGKARRNDAKQEE